MARVQALLEAFNAGEVSEKLSTRLSFEKYPLACATLKNAVPLVQGAFTRRPGTRYVAAVKDETAKSRLLRFEFNTEQAYIAELGNQYIRFFRNQGQISVANTDASITNGTFTAGITGWDDRSTGGAGNQISHDSTNGRLNLTPNGTAVDDIGWAEQAVSVGASFDTVEHVLKFRVLGAPGDKILFRIGSTSTGEEIVADTEFAVGYHAFAFTPGDGNNTVYIQFRNVGAFRNKTLQIDDVALIDDAPVELTTPYATADLFSLNRAQSNDVLYVVCRGYPVYKLTRSGHSSWSLIEVDWQDGPWRAVNDETTTITMGAATGFGVTATASSTDGINDGAGFKDSDVGRLIRISDDTNWAWGVIVGRTSATVVTVDHRGETAFPTTAKTDWRLGAWSGTDGYPCAVTFFEGRLGLGGTNAQPQALWLSQSNDFENQAPDSKQTSGAPKVEDDDALDISLVASQANIIRWMAGAQALIVGTTGGEWLIKSDGPIIKPTDIDAKRQTAHGSANLQPLEIGPVIVFLQSARRKIRELVFDFNTDSLRAPDLTVLADHATRSGVVDVAYQEEPQSTVWAVRTDGVIAGLTYEREQNVVGWSRHVLGGSFGSGDAVAETVAVIPGNDGAGQVFDSSERDEVWVVVKRTINGQTRRYVEFFEGAFEGPRLDDYASEALWRAAALSEQPNAFYVDSGGTYDGAATTTVSGLDHLEGETVTILADGAIHPSKVVSGGSITLDQAASKVQVGLAYTHTYRSLKMAVGARAGSAVGVTKRIHELTLVLLHSLGSGVGPRRENLQPLIYREVGDAMDAAVPLFSGEKVTETDHDWGTDPRIVIEGAEPAPFTCLGMVPEVTTNDGR